MNYFLAPGLYRLYPEKPNKRFNEKEIIETLCSLYDFEMKELKSRKKPQAISLRKQIILFMIYRYCGKSIRKIKAIFNYSDQKSVYYALSRIRNLHETGDKLCRTLLKEAEISILNIIQ